MKILIVIREEIYFAYPFVNSILIVIHKEIYFAYPFVNSINKMLYEIALII